MNSSIVEEALKYLERQCQGMKLSEKISAPDDIINYLVLKLSSDKVESFGMVLVNQQNVIMDVVSLETGIENRCHIYLKKAVKEILNSNATGVIFFHNHPSGSSNFFKRGH